MRYLITILTIVVLILPISTLAEETEIKIEPITRPTVRIFNTVNFQVEKEFFPFTEDSKSEGLNLATADLDNNGSKEIIVASGRNDLPIIKVFNNQAEPQFQFMAYADNYQKGVKVTIADLYNDGVPEIITSTEKGGGPHINIFNNEGEKYFGFFAFDSELSGGVNVTAGDVNGDGQKEIIAGAGYGMEPKIRIFDNYTNLLTEFSVYEHGFTGGVNVLAADLNNDGTDEIIVAPAIDKEPLVRIYNFKGEPQTEFLAYPAAFWGGVNLAKSDIDHDGSYEILTGSGFTGGAHLRIFNAQGTPIVHPNLFVYDNFKGGISVSATDINNDGKANLIAGTQTISIDNNYKTYKSIEIDLNKQKLYALFKGEIEKEFIISSGRWQFPTPHGEFKIYAKVPETNMSGYYGPNHPENYNLPGVPYVMPFYKNYAIHGAYWHWNFGTRVSHGCINMKIPDAKWLYNWSNLKTPVIIYSSK